MKTTIQSVKGTRDFYPEDIAVRVWLYNAIRSVAEAYGYQEYDGPFLEKIDLYAAKSGEELVKEQAFVFPDRSGELITLRPELTPSLARMIAQRQNSLVFPTRWWSFGPFWRYERPQKGRSREFFQWNADILGPVTPEADAELAAIAVGFFRKVGLRPDQVNLLVNNRRLMDAKLQNLGVGAGQKSDVFHLIDRRDKMRPADWEAYALEIGLTSVQLDGLKGLLSDKDLWQQSDELVRFFDALEALGAREYVRFDPQIIRGLDYYTGTVFEARDADGEFRAVLGGGRYDNLVADVGGEPLSGMGFAMGDVVVTLLLKKYGCIPELPLSPAQVLVTVFDAERVLDSQSFATELRQAGLKVNCYPETSRLEKQLKFADRMGMSVVVILGPDEAAQGKVTLRDLANRRQEMVKRGEAAEAIRRMLAGEASS
jgi:histidyl-tRNA synthetase